MRAAPPAAWGGSGGGGEGGGPAPGGGGGGGGGRSGGGTRSTVMTWEMGGRMPATPWPAMMAWVYSGRPKPAAKAKAPFCMSPHAQADQATTRSRKARYAAAETSRKQAVDAARRPKAATFITSAALIRKGYDAAYCALVSSSIAA